MVSSGSFKGLRFCGAKSFLRFNQGFIGLFRCNSLRAPSGVTRARAFSACGSCWLFIPGPYLDSRHNHPKY